MMRIRNRPILAAVCASALSFQTAAALSPRQIRWTYRESSISFLRSPQASRNRDEDFNNDKDQWSTTRLSTSTDYEIVDNDDDDEKMAVSWQKQSRRRLLLLKPLRAVTTLLPLLLLRPASTSARGLVQFPCKTPLANNYHLMRAGTTMLEEEGMWSTNPLFLTNRDDALSPAGEEQVVAACQLLQQGTFPPTLVKYSLAASSIDAANLVGRELRLGRDRLVPEFTFLDPRAVGAWDSSNRTTTLPAVWAMDNDEAGRDGLLGRPPATVDGTPHEVLADQAVRLRQLLSILESQYSGDTILLIFPDGTGPALLSAMIAGIPYNRVHELEFGPGEVRFDVTMDSTLALWKTKQLQDGEAYHAVLQQGRENLKRLRATAKNGGTVVNLKDQKLEEERVAIDQKMRERESVRVAAEKIDQELRLKRQREVEVQRGEISVSPTVTGAAEFAVLGGVVLAVGSEWNRNADAKKDDKKSIGAVSSQPELIATIPELDIMADPGLYPTPVAGATKQGVVGASSGGSVADKGEVLDLKEAAVRAMEEYMNKDDGADDWLMSLSQIIEETVDEEESEVKDSVQGIVVPDDEESFQ